MFWEIGTSASVINYRVLKNGSSVVQTSGASAAANQVWTHTHWRTFDVVVGDVLEIRYWAVQADVTLEFYGLIAYPSQPDVSKRGTILKDLALGSLLTTPNFTTATTTVQTGNFLIYPAPTTTASLSISGALTLSAIIPYTLYGLFRNTSGESNAASTNQAVHATQIQIQKLLFPSTITFREVLR